MAAQGIAARVRVEPGGREFVAEPGDTLLEAALRAGLALNYGCSNGNCGQCRARLLSGEAQKVRHSDYVLTAAEKSAGVLLLCCSGALTDLAIEAGEAQGADDIAPQDIAARVKSVRALSDNVRLLHVQTPRSNRLRFLAGQSVALTLAGGAGAVLPVASCPCDERNLEFHIERSAATAFAQAVFDTVKSGDAVRVEGPCGDFVLNEASGRPLAFIACGSGFAPVKSLIEHAIALETRCAMQLCWIASDATGHYLDNLCRSWADALDDFRYVPVRIERELSRDAVHDALARTLHQDVRERDVYVSAPQPLAHEVRRLLLERGVARAQLFVNASVPA